MSNKWFEVDKEGLAKLLERKGGKSFVLFELFQNTWDENTKKAQASLEPIPSKPQCRIVVEDDNPNGFADLRDAFTLFAESKKKSDPSKRGRFNLGEKLVLACCVEASISSTTGTIIFDQSGVRKRTKAKTEQGSRFEAILRINRQEYAQMLCEASKLNPPPSIETILNGTRIDSRPTLAEFEATLPTEIADEEGNLRKTKRKTTVKVFEPKDNEVASIYEMGIPVVETGDRFHVDVQQKIPLNMDRDNVTPAYLKEIRTATLNHTYQILKKEQDLDQSWVNNALEDKNCDPKAVKHIINNRFGENAVAYDPSDLEGTKLSFSEGRNVIHGRQFNKQQWRNIRNAKVLPAAGKVTPSPNPYSVNGKPLKVIDPSDYHKYSGMEQVVNYSKMLGNKLLDCQVQVNVVKGPIGWNYLATYGKGKLVINFTKLGRGFFNQFPENAVKVDDLLLHEFGHHYSGDHLSSEYHDALTRLGAKLKKLALDEPRIFEEFGMLAC